MIRATRGARRSASITALLAALTSAGAVTGCKPSTPEDAQPRRVEPEERASVEPAKVRLEAAGVTLTLPPGWTLLGEDEPNFALAWTADERNPQVPICTIELRRQGPGPLPDDAAETKPGSGVFKYSRGSLRGQIRSIPGPDGSAVVVHCRAGRSSLHWRAILEAMPGIELSGPEASLPAPAPTNDAAIVELCSSTRNAISPVCVRRADGSVYCGRSDRPALDRVALAEPAVQIACVGPGACALDATGALHCWSPDAPTPAAIPGGSGARDLADGLVVTAAGGLSILLPTGLTELAPFGDAALALTGVERALPGSRESAGCVLREGGLWCWDDAHQLPLDLAEGGRPQEVAGFAGADDLRRIGGRICVAREDRWTCLERDGAPFELDGCGTRPCGCSLQGSSRFSCEEAPYDPIDARPLGRVDGVVAVAEPCVALADGTLLCRGPTVGTAEEDPQATARVHSDTPRIAHTVALRDTAP